MCIALALSHILSLLPLTRCVRFCVAKVKTRAVDIFTSRASVTKGERRRQRMNGKMRVTFVRVWVYIHFPHCWCCTILSFTLFLDAFTLFLSLYRYLYVENHCIFRYHIWLCEWQYSVHTLSLIWTSFSFGSKFPFVSLSQYANFIPILLYVPLKWYSSTLKETHNILPIKPIKFKWKRFFPLPNKNPKHI